MKVKVTLSAVLDDELWDAVQMYRDGGADGVIELVKEDIAYLVDEGEWRVEVVDDADNTG